MYNAFTNYSRTRKIIIFSLILLISVVLIYFWLFTQQDKRVVDVAIKDSNNTITLQVADEYKAYFQKRSVSRLHDSIGNKVTGSKKSGSIIGYVRKGSLTSEEGSFTTSSTTTVLSIINFIIDFPDIKQSYIIHWTGDDSQPYQKINIQCPQEKDLIYERFTCDDSAS